MTRGGVTDRLSVDLAGAGFEAAILIGGIILGGYVDRTKEYKKVTMACLLTTAFMCLVSNDSGDCTMHVFGAYLV